MHIIIENDITIRGFQHTLRYIELTSAVLDFYTYDNGTLVRVTYTYDDGDYAKAMSNFIKMDIETNRGR